MNIVVCDQLSAVRASPALRGAGCDRARVGCDQKSLATLVFALAVPHTRVHSSTRRSAWSRRPPGELGGDVRSAVLSLAPSTRGHLQVATTSSSRGLRATAGSTGTHSMRYFKAGCSRVAERGTGSHAALAGFSPTFSWGVTMKCTDIAIRRVLCTPMSTKESSHTFIHMNDKY